MKSALKLFVGTCFVVVIAPRDVSAVPLSWNSPAGGAAAQPLNWSPSQLPTAADDLIYNLINTYNLTFNAVVPTSRTGTYKRGVVTLSISSPHTATDGFDIGDVSGDNADLTLAAGDLTVNANVNVGDASGSIGTLTLDGSDATITVVGAASDLNIGRAGSGTLELFGGAEILVDDDIIIGATSSGVGEALISGGTGTFPNLFRSNVQTTSDTTGDVFIGNSGEGVLTLTNGGVVHAARDVKMAPNSSATSLVDVSGSFSLFPSTIIADRNLDVSRNDSIFAAGSAILTLNAGTSALVTGLTRIGDAHGGSGTIELNSGFLTSDGGIDIQPNGTIVGTGTINGNITNLGSIEPTGAAGLQINDVLTNATNDVVGTKINFGAGGGYIGSGTCNAEISGDPTSIITATGDLTLGRATTNGYFYLGSLDVGNNDVTLLDSNGAVLGGQTVLDGGQLESTPGIGIQNGGVVIGEGTLVGNVTNSGLLDPHRSDSLGGIMAIQGNLHMNPTGIFDMEIGGLPGSGSNDRLNVSGSATFNGQVDVSFKNGFVPRVGQQFIAINATAGRVGEFAGVIPPTGIDAVCNDTTIVLVYSSTAAIILIRPPLGCTALGDLNSNGGCEGTDIQIFVENILNGQYDACADMNGDCADDTGDIANFVACLL